MPVAKGDYLGEFEQLVLWALVRLRENAYGMTIRRELEERTRRVVSIGSVYATLDRLEEKGYVRSRPGEATPERGGRARRYFALTATGAAALSAARTTLTGLWRRQVPHGVGKAGPA